jgi:hypothetical protein
VIEAALHQVPRRRRVLLAQLHLVAANLRRPALGGAAIVALGTMLLIIDAVGDNGHRDDLARAWRRSISGR